MKNKHLVLIFIATLVLGLAVRYAPWFKNDIFVTNLLEIDSSQLQQILIKCPGNSELLLEHGGEGWIAVQDDFAVRTADSSMLAVLSTLAQIRSLRIAQSKLEDTLLLGKGQAIQVDLLLKNGNKYCLEIGQEILEHGVAANYMKLDKADAIYVINKHLRRVFTLDIDDFRSRKILEPNPGQLESVQICRPEVDTIYFEPSDSAGFWLNRSLKRFIAGEDLELWHLALFQLNGLPFATHNEERLVYDNLALHIALSYENEEEPVVLDFFDTGLRLKSSVNSRRISLEEPRPAYIVQSSQNSFNFFALSDTALMRSIQRGPIESD